MVKNQWLCSQNDNLTNGHSDKPTSMHLFIVALIECCMVTTRAILIWVTSICLCGSIKLSAPRKVYREREPRYTGTMSSLPTKILCSNSTNWKERNHKEIIWSESHLMIAFEKYHNEWRDRSNIHLYKLLSTLDITMMAHKLCSSSGAIEISREDKT